ncbi:MAG: D-aminoacyl-tRNA deacylase [Bacteroidales bacterium]|nr:D-aminoacyl-tRNA deacylase [Bacteroidales bacterium]
MKAVIQRVIKASVSVNGELCGSINKGLLVLIGIEEKDEIGDMNWMAEKICNLRIFNDEKGVMNLSIKQDGGNLLIISQFTLCANTQKGHRPSYIKAAKPERAKDMYEDFCRLCSTILNKKTEQGVFGAHMLVELINDGPVTILLDSKDKKQ